MPKGRVLLVGALGAVAVLETVGIVTDSDTISALVADTFHADTNVGRAIFAGTWLAFTGWFLFHIVTFAKSVKAAGSKSGTR
jgi:hypothetical protein